MYFYLLRCKNLIKKHQELKIILKIKSRNVIIIIIF